MNIQDRHVSELHEEIHIQANKAKFMQAFADAHLRAGNIDQHELFQTEADRADRSAKRLNELIPIVA